MLRWIDEQRFVVGDTTFLSTGDKDFNDERFLAFFVSAESRVDRFVVWKTRAIIDRYAELVQHLQARHIFELGILKGGSTAFLAAIAQPERLVAVDVAEGEVEALKQFLGQQQLAANVKTYYGVDQADRRRLEAILGDEFAGAQLDLVIDDASHRLDATRASFNTLFPRLRPGGVYVIEDWSWAHALRAVDVTDMGPPLTTLIFEIVVACATFRDVIDTVEINWGVAFITRGAGAADAAFDVAEPYAAARGGGLDTL